MESEARDSSKSLTREYEPEG
jgi:hypothetical protein